LLQSLTLEGNHFNVMSATRVFSQKSPGTQRRIFHSGVKPFKCRPLQFAADYLLAMETLLNIAEYIQERSRSNVVCAARHLVGLTVCCVIDTLR